MGKEWERELEEERVRGGERGGRVREERQLASERGGRVRWRQGEG